ncbi:unnamed protein product, partial [Candidula unifasciata]
IDECRQRGLCPAMSKCLNTVGSYQCQCNTGYRLNGSSLCEDIDECNKTSTFTCPTNSNCTNTPGSYTCLCIKDTRRTMMSVKILTSARALARSPVLHTVPAVIHGEAIFASAMEDTR